MIPDKLVNFMCYDEGNQMLGITDVSLPTLSYITDEIQGAGIAGTIDSPVIGHFQSLTITINWRSLIAENITFLAPRTYLFDFRGSVQIYDQNTGEFPTKAIKVVVNCKPKQFTLGDLNTASQMGTNGEFELTYIKVSIDGQEKVEIDKINFICRIDGIDYLAKVRQDIGLS